MSKNISIAEGGVGRQFTNDKLKINLVGGGTEYYVPESGVQLTTKSVTANGTYKASDVGKYGFSQFSVNVRGGAGSADSSGKPTTSGGTAPGGAGSAVVGTDPETGNDVAVGVDENGNLVQTPVPSGIEIITPPTKTSYVYQETMDYTGIVVAAKKKDGTTFTDARYTNGHIPMQELIFPVDKAPASGQSYGDWSANPSWVCSTANTYLGRVSDRSFRKSYDGPAIAAFGVNYNGGWYGPITISDVESYVTTNFSGFAGTFVWEGKTFFANYGYHYRSPNYDSGGLHEISGATLGETLTNIMNAASVHVSGGSGGTATIPVEWNNPYTGDTHRDTFEITSTGSSGSSSTTTGSSGTEGSGGGGSF